MSVTLTERAAAEVKKVIEAQNAETPLHLRIGVAAGGCSGFDYKLNLDPSFDPEKDSKIDCHGVAVVVDKKSDLFLDGTTVDFLDGLDRRGFAFSNPNAVKTCGCGSSFSV
jgi:iron-sulfur cluster assembly protein